MAVKIPMAMPDHGPAQQYFEPQTVDYVTPEASGYVGSVSVAGQDLWVAQWDLGKIGARKSDEWRAWAAQVAVTRGCFFASDRARPFPLRYLADGFVRMTSPDGAHPFTGAASNWAQTIDDQDRPMLTLEGLAAGLVLEPGDYIGFKWDSEDAAPGTFDRRALVRVGWNGGGMADATGTLTVTVVPAVPTLTVPVDAVAHLDRPCCVMAFVPADRRLGAIDRRLAVTSGSFQAVQDLRP